MKNKLKYLIAAVLALSIIAGGAVCAYADEYESDNAIEGGDISTREPGTEYEIPTNEGASSGDAAVENASKSDTGTGEEDSTFFTRVYEELMSYASEILCALTLAGSLTLAVAYKKGLLPLLEGSLVTIGNAITKIKESTKESAEASTASSEKMERRLADASELIEALKEKTDRLALKLEKELEAKSSDRSERQRLTAVISEQIDMLYDIFMSAELPQYQKDAVGERVGKMKEATRENGYEN